MTTIASRWLIAVVLCGGLLTASASAQRAHESALDGVYNGSYTGDQGPAKFKLTITRQDNNGYHIGAVLTLYIAESSGTNAYTCDLDGTYIERGGFLQLRRTKWETAAPSSGGIELLGLNGSFHSGRRGNRPDTVTGIIGGERAYKFEAVRDAAESAKIATANTAEETVGAPVTPAGSRVGRQPTAASRAARAAPSLASAPAPVDVRSPTFINGIYTGTYGSNADDNVSAKLYVTYSDDGYGYAGNFALTGLFTLDVPLSVGAQPVTYTYKLKGRYNSGAFDFAAQPMGKPAPDAYAVEGLSLNFVTESLGSGPNPDKISSIINRFRPARNSFEAIRDKAESSNLDSLMAAIASAAGPVVNTTAPTAQIDRPTIVGVYNGTYTREKGPPTKFKLTITHPPYTDGYTDVAGLAGLATIYLPTDSGTKAYTYSLTGSADAEGHGRFHLFVHDWETPPPKDFQNFRGMGFIGTFLSNANQHRARIVSLPTAEYTSFASDCIPNFEATWDATESADIKGTIAAQKAVRDADQVAALKERAELIKNAPPKQLAPTGLVRKSQAYWNSYHGDSVRQIFDGGFADDADNDPSFRANFITYVDLFAKNCRANLPANHHTITIVTVTSGVGYTNTKESKTLDIDPRFIKKYCEFSEVEPEPGSPEASDLLAKNVQIFRRVMKAGSPAGRESNGDAFALLRLGLAHAADDRRDLNKFFATESGSSAAMRQLTENFLRAATGEPSLQEAGEKIAGAEAETDKDVPPGRFTHLIDAANAWCRDPDNAQYLSQYETTFYMLLAEKYRGVMTPEEEYYYANDFAVRFRDQIMQPRANSTDPAWPRLHPAVAECRQELGR